MADKKYVRDKRSPTPKSEGVSKVMSANKAKGTKPELILRRALYVNGLRGYRLNYKSIPGRPDITFVKYKIAVFVNGCYWHRCPKCNYPLPKHNTEFWKDKFTKNINRDKLKVEQLEKLGWTVITIWECDIKNDINQIITTIREEF